MNFLQQILKKTKLSNKLLLGGNISLVFSVTAAFLSRESVGILPEFINMIGSVGILASGGSIIGGVIVRPQSGKTFELHLLEERLHDMTFHLVMARKRNGHDYGFKKEGENPDRPKATIYAIS